MAFTDRSKHLLFSLALSLATQPQEERSVRRCRVLLWVGTSARAAAWGRTFLPWSCCTKHQQPSRVAGVSSLWGSRRGGFMMFFSPLWKTEEIGTGHFFPSPFKYLCGNWGNKNLRHLNLWEIFDLTYKKSFPCPLTGSPHAGGWFHFSLLCFQRVRWAMGDSATGHRSYQAPVLPSTLRVLDHMVGLSCVSGEKALGACEFFQ